MKIPDASLCHILQQKINLHIVDIGASLLDGHRPYRALLSLEGTKVTGFEPQKEEYEKLRKISSPREHYLPYVLGDGQTHTLHICQAPGMTSLLEPDPNLLDMFPGFAEWGKVKSTIPVQTVRMDDIEELKDIDYIKADVQGAELMIFNHGLEKLASCLVIHTEVNFLPFYKNHPLFGDVDRFMRSRGFMLHTFTDLIKRMVKPLIKKNDLYAGMNQLVWTDGVYIRSMETWDSLPSSRLLPFALIMHDVYQSYDICLKLLIEYDRREKTSLGNLYINRLGDKRL